MGRRFYLLICTLFGCDFLFTNNPNNCVLAPNICGRDMFCNAVTQSCETLDCTVNTGLCHEGEFCAPASQRCQVKTCVIDPSLCSDTQLCDPALAQCQTRQFVIGQPAVGTNVNVAYGLSAPYSVLLVPDPNDSTKTKLVVGDTANLRVLIWNDVPTQNQPADVVFGMPDVSTVNGTIPYAATSEFSVNNPWSLTSDGSRLIIGDLALNRLLVWNQIPTAVSNSGPPPANRVWGQNDFGSGQANGGQLTVGALGLAQPRVFLERTASGMFYAIDSVNHRVLVFAGVPSSTQSAPAFVLGQPTLTSAVAGNAATSLNAPRSVFSDGTQLFIADTNNHRVLGYAPLPVVQSGNGQAATSVLGQAGFGVGNNLANRGGAVGPATLNSPTAVWLLGGAPPSLLVVDQSNHRVLRFPVGDTQANLVLGQPDLTSNLANRGGVPTASTLNQPTDLSSDGTRLVVADRNNNRVLIWNTLPTQDGQAADLVLGQPDFRSALANNPPSRSALIFRNPQQVATDGQRLVVADSAQHRVLLWLQLPRDGNTPPDVVLGQASATGVAANTGLSAPTAATLSNPTGVAIAGDMLVIADTGNHRVLIYNQIPTQSFASADLVLGQLNFTTQTLQTAPTGMNQPGAVLLSQGQLYVADTGYNRVLLFRSPLRSSVAADLVLGQPSLSTGAPNNGGLAARSLVNPRALALTQGKLLVADRGNHRVLIWNTEPTSNFQPANVVVGQNDFANAYARVSRSNFNAPSGLLVTGNRLYVASPVQNRILYWDQIPTTNGQPADGVLGQGNFLSALPNNPDVAPIEKLASPFGLTAAADQLFIADGLNSRVVVRSVP